MAAYARAAGALPGPQERQAAEAPPARPLLPAPGVEEPADETRIPLAEAILPDTAPEATDSPAVEETGPENEKDLGPAHGKDLQGLPEKPVVWLLGL